MGDVSVVAVIYMAIIFVAFFLLYEKGKKNYQAFCEVLSKEEYPLKSLMPIGYAVMDLIKYQYASAFDRKVRRQLRELREEEYVEFYLRTTWAMAATYLWIGIFLSGLISLASVEIIVVIAVLAFGVLLGYTAFNDLDKKIAKRHLQITMDLPDFTNKLLILSGAGLSLKAAMIKVSNEMNKETPFYQELKHSVFLMENGTPVESAMDTLCNRCNMPEVRRLSSVLLQNIHSGGSDVLLALKEISRELWNNRRAAAKRAAEEAGTKLLFPMMLMLLAVILVVAAPAMMSLSLQ